jgi:hypothetical protein
MDRNSFRRLFSTISDLHFLSSIFKGLFSGHDAAEDADDMVKGVSGMFGFADERRMLVLLMSLDERTPGAADVVLEYLTKHFSTEGVSWEAKIYIIRQKNRFRDLVVDMGSSDGSKTGETTTTIDGNIDKGKYKHVRKEDVRSSGRNNSLSLLVKMHDILTGPGTAEEQTENCTRFLVSAGAPMVDRRWVTTLHGGGAKLASKAREAFDSILERAQSQGIDAGEILRRLNVTSTNYVGTKARQVERRVAQQEQRRSWGQKIFETFFGR